MENMKTCSKCGEGKEEGEFFKAKDTKDGFRGECKQCHNIWAKARYPETKEAIRARQQKYYRDNAKDILEKRRRQWPELKKKERFKRSLASSRNWAKKKGYASCNTTEREITDAFTGRCHICNKAEDDLSRCLDLDHNHMTGEFKGWLCTSCNRAIGLLQESPEIIKKALEYTIKHGT